MTILIQCSWRQQLEVDMQALFRRFFKKSETVGSHPETFVSGQYAAITTINEQQATDEMVKGMQHFLDMAERVQDKLPHFRRGHLFEAIVAAKENAELATTGMNERYIITHLDGRNTAPADLELYSNGALISEAQAKFSIQPAKKIVGMISDPKYDGMDRYIPANKIEDVQRELTKQIRECNDPQKMADLKDALQHIKRHDTASVEVWQADRNPAQYAMEMEVKYVGQEMLTAGSQAAVGAAVVGGGISLVKNIISAYNGKLSASEAAGNIAKDTAQSALKGGTAGSAGALIRCGAEKAGLQTLAKSNVAMAVAGSVVEVGTIVYDFAQGKIDGETAMIRMGQTGTSTVSGLYAGAAAGAVFGPPGAVIGSMVGYMLASSTYQSCVAIMERAKLADSESKRLVELTDAACKAMQEQRAEFERLVEEKVRCKKSEFRNAFFSIDNAINRKEFYQATEGMANLAGLFGKKLNLQNFSDFDTYMRSSDAPLRL
nr:hypothetical protein [Sporomusa silvacetica]